MTYYPDLAPLDYFDRRWSERLVAVGWLDRDHPFPRGPVATQVMNRLVELAADPWEPMHFMGLVLCGFCNVDGNNREEVWRVTHVRFSGRLVNVGASNLFIPGAKRVYVAPSLILHYISAHQYKPPDVFCDAVVACPPMRSRSYARAMLRRGPRAFRWMDFPARPVPPWRMVVAENAGRVHGRSDRLNAFLEYLFGQRIR